MKQVRFLNKIVRVSTATGCAVAMASCAELGDGAMGMDGDQPFYDEERDQGLEELGAPLTALATACTFTTVAGVLRTVRPPSSPSDRLTAPSSSTAHSAARPPQRRSSASSSRGRRAPTSSSSTS
jgi:hypothetical protein